MIHRNVCVDRDRTQPISLFKLLSEYEMEEKCLYQYCWWAAQFHLMHVYVIFRRIGMCFDRVNAITAAQWTLFREQYRGRSDKHKNTVIRCTNSSVNVRAGQKPIAIVSQLFVHFVSSIETKTNGENMLWHIGLFDSILFISNCHFINCFVFAHIYLPFECTQKSAMRENWLCSQLWNESFVRINWRKLKTKRWLLFFSLSLSLQYLINIECDCDVNGPAVNTAYS